MTTNRKKKPPKKKRRMHRYVLANGLRLRSSPLKLVRFVTQSHYDILGLKRNATQDEIKAAYKEMSKKLHPDVNRVDPETHDKFIQLKDAYTVLSKTVTRLQYDRELELRRQYSEQMYKNNYEEFDTQYSGFGGNFSSYDEEILKQRARSKQFSESQIKQLKTDAGHVISLLLFVGITFSFAVSRMSNSKKNNNSMLARESIEVDKRFIREMQLIDEQSTDELIEEVERIQKALAGEKS